MTVTQDTNKIQEIFEKITSVERDVAFMTSERQTELKEKKKAGELAAKQEVEAAKAEEKAQEINLDNNNGGWFRGKQAETGDPNKNLQATPAKRLSFFR